MRYVTAVFDVYDDGYKLRRRVLRRCRYAVGTVGAPTVESVHFFPALWLLPHWDIDGIRL